jgi:hypothetical protein
MLTALLILSPLAQAGDAFHAKSSNVEFRMGPASLTDGDIQTVYGEEGNQFLFLESGLQFFRVLELDAGLGLLRESDAAVGADSGDESGYTTRLSLMPVSVSATLRLDVFDGQPVVPFASGGVDYWLWTEQQNIGDGYLMGTSTKGGKLGYHYGFGFNVLLDMFAKNRASRAEARWGIKDSYLVIDYRLQETLSEEGLSFGGSVITAGLKIDR